MGALTAKEKARRVAEWRSIRERFEVTEAPSDTAGKGYPDPAIFALTDRLNAIDGVCTLQSCSGHARTKQRRWSASGQLWLRLSDAMFAEFLMAVPELVAHPRVEEACVKWGRERVGPVVEITFDGLNVSAARLQQSSDEITAFFSELNGPDA